MNPPKMPIHIGDYMRDTGHLRAAEHGAYLMLLFHHWSTGGLPDDDRQLAAIARMSSAEWKRARPILEKFFNPGWHHGRVGDDLAAARASYEKRAKAGEKGGKAKAEGKHSSSNATAGPEQPLTFNQNTNSEEAKASSSRTRKARAIPEEWSLSPEDEEYATSRGWSVAYTHSEAERFKNHFIASGSAKKDWNAAWRNWVTSPYQKTANGMNGHGKGPSLMDAFDRLDDRAAGAAFGAGPEIRDVTPGSDQGG